MQGIEPNIGAVVTDSLLTEVRKLQGVSAIGMDEIRAMLFALEQARLEGPVNFVAPNPVTNAELMRACARALHRPALVPVPAFALRLVLGKFATELLISQRIVPRKLLDAGFSFTQAEIDEAAKTLA